MSKEWRKGAIVEYIYDGSLYVLKRRLGKTFWKVDTIVECGHAEGWGSVEQSDLRVVGHIEKEGK